MTVGNIINAVRLCIDEEATNDASFTNAQGGDSTRMNNIIRYKIPYALRWVCLYAPAEQLSGGGSSGSGTSIDVIQEESSLSASNNIITPNSTLVRVIRVMGSSWSRAILGDSLIGEDSDEYLQQSDTLAVATNDRPHAALVNTKFKKVAVFPSTGTFTLTYIKALSSTDISNLNSDSTNVNVPGNVETSFIYYLAYLTCSAYGDARAKSMLEIAIQNLGRTDDKQRQ
jgi:hypothetical protein